VEERFAGEENVEYDRWAPYYEKIRQEFDFPLDREQESAAELLRRLPEPARLRPLERCTARLSAREVIVVGLAPGAGPPPLWLRRRGAPAPVLVAADGATARLLEAGLTPDLVVTDLDGPVPSEVTANSRGALVLIHAHGDNRPAIERWTPEFPGELAGSWAGPPRPGLLNVGGFTDGDRAVFLAHHAAARRIVLWGFDFERVSEPDPLAAEVKRRKLGWARRLIGELASRGTTPISVALSDGTERAYNALGTGPSTQ
jgi:uncharacterized Rossmann fold enzyme